MKDDGVTNMARLERIVAKLPEAERVDIAEWGDHPTFRVRGKNFVFCDAEAVHLSVKLPKDEAEAVVATDPRVEPAGYGLGRHGWIAITLDSRSTLTAGKNSRSGCAPRTHWLRPRPSHRSCLKRTLVRFCSTTTAEQNDVRLPAGETLGLGAECVADR